MNPTMKVILGVLAGIVVFMILVMIIQLTGHMLMPPPSDVELTSPDDLAAYIAANPVILLPVLVAYIVGSFGGGYVAAAIAKARPIAAAVGVGIAGMIGNIVNVNSIPHPLWFVVTSFLIFVPLAWVGGRLAAGRPG